MLSSLHEVYKYAVDLWQQIHPVWAGAVTAIAGLIAFRIKFSAVKEWMKGIVETYDGRVLCLLKEARRTAQVNMRPGQSALFLPFSFQEIVKGVKRKQKSVHHSLRRLEDRGEVHEVRDGWNLGPRLDALTLANIEQSAGMPSRWNSSRFNRGRA